MADQFLLYQRGIYFFLNAIAFSGLTRIAGGFIHVPIPEHNKINKQRAKHYNHFTNKNWNSFENYDLVINVDKLGVEETAEMIKNIILSEDKK